MKYLISWWIILFTIFIYVFQLRLDIFDSIYFFLITASTVGYGEILPITIPEKLLVTITVLTSLASISTIITITIQYLLKRKKMDKFKGHIEHLIVTSDPDKLEVMLNECKPDTHVIVDGEPSAEDIDKFNILRARFSCKLTYQSSLYDITFLNEVESIGSVVVTSSPKSSVAENNHRVFGIIQVLESLYPCRTIGEAKGNIENLKKLSNGDLMVPISDGVILAHELIEQGAFKAQNDLINDLRKRKR